MPKIAILTSVYADTFEKARWLEDAVNSVKKQSFTDWEHLIINDASAISINGIRDSLESDNRFRWFEGPENQGVAKSRNVIAALAESEAIIVLDADDLFPVQALELFYDEWEKDKSKWIYSNIEKHVWKDGQFVKRPIQKFADYTFERSKVPTGLSTVSALHSVECHRAAGGWKPELVDGLEDVEYWLAAGKAGFCGHRINETCLIYRRHKTGRTHYLIGIKGKQKKMEQMIMDMHSDVYNGRYPMGCCGGSTGAIVAAPQINSVSRAAGLDQFAAQEKVWVQYQGSRNAAFGIRGKGTGISYNILGHGAKVEVHVSDVHIFKQSGRGQDFLVGVAPPEDIIIEPEPQSGQPGRYVAPVPQLATIVELDKVALAARQ